MQGTLTQSRYVVCGLLAALGMLASGCATSKYGEQITTVNHYPQCYAPIQELRQADKDFNTTVAVSTTVGVIGGALIGFLASGGKAQGAAIGAAAGGVAGAGVGYAKAKQERIADDNRRMSSYLVDIEGDISGIDRATAAARVARDCYTREFQQAIAGYKAGSLTKTELTSRYTEIKNGCIEAASILDSMISTTDDKEREYQMAVQEEARLANRPAPVIAAPAPKPRATAASTSPSRSATASAKSSSAKPAETQTVAASRTAPPRPGDASLEAVAQSTQRLGESKQSAAEEQESLRKMQEEMDGTLATVLS